MTHKTNILAVLALLVGCSSGPTVSVAQIKSTATRVPDQAATALELRACWLTQYAYVGKSESQLRAIAQNIKAGAMNTVYVAMYSGAQTYWPSQAYRAAGGSWASSTIDYASYLTDIFHDEGLVVGAWFEYGLAVGVATHPLAGEHPDWLARDRWGDPVTGENGGFVFLSPGCSEATDMIVAMARELAENYNFDDIQLDRIRWGRKTEGREYGYEDCTANLYYAQYGCYPPTNENDAQWVRFREELVNDVVQRCHAAIKSANPEIIVSAAPTGSYGIVQHMQRWSDWIDGGYIDLVLPQAYRTSLSSFIDEFDILSAQVPDQLDQLGIGYRASEDDDWQTVADQLNYSRGAGIPHACLWVYHQYSAQIAIQDEIDNLPLAGRPWEQPAVNPFSSNHLVQLIIDNRDGQQRYNESGFWSNSAQPDYFRFDSRVASGGSAAGAEFQLQIPKTGRYDVYTWYTSSTNRNDQARYLIQHHLGLSELRVDQRSGGGAWVSLGRWIFAQDSPASNIILTNLGSDALEYTSSDAVKLVLRGYALGDANGDGLVDGNDFNALPDCFTGPDRELFEPVCEAFDFDDDLDIDISDLAEFQQSFTGG